MVKEKDIRDRKSLGEKIVIKKDTSTLLILQEEVIFAEKVHKKLLVHTKREVYQTNQSLGQFEKELNDNFLKVHRGYIVNQNKIRKVKDLGNRSYEVEFIDYDKKALVSRYKIEELKVRLKI